MKSVLVYKCETCGKISEGSIGYSGDKTGYPADRSKCSDTIRHHCWIVSKDEADFSESQKEEVARIRRLSNADLFGQTLQIQCGDDYDGCFTNWGEFCCEYLSKELEERLADWLEK